jgi:hypothetical protein
MTRYCGIALLTLIATSAYGQVFGVKISTGSNPDTVCNGSTCTLLFQFDASSAADIGLIQLEGVTQGVDVDGLALGPGGTLYGFANRDGSSQLVRINPADAAGAWPSKTVPAIRIGQGLAGRIIRAATFDTARRLIAVDVAGGPKLLQVNAVTGEATVLATLTYSGSIDYAFSDLAAHGGGTLYLTAYDNASPATLLFTVNTATGDLTLVGRDAQPPALECGYPAVSGTTPPAHVGIAFSPVAPDALLALNSNGWEDVFQFAGVTAFGVSRTMLYERLYPEGISANCRLFSSVPASWNTTYYFNGGLGDLAAEPAGGSGEPAPEITGMPGTNCIIWPANNKLVAVGTIIAVRGVSALSEFQVSVTANEPIDAGDVIISGANFDPKTVYLRARRDGSGTGRTYTITAAAANAGGRNSVTGTCTVPHDMRKQ